MAKLIMEFDLNDEDDAELFRLKNQGEALHAVTFYFDRWLRQYIEYCDECSEELISSLETIHAKFHDLLCEYKVDID